jgi:hypothetical protein
MGDFASPFLGPRGSLKGAEGLKARVKSNPNFLAATPSTALRPKFYNDQGPFGPKNRNVDRVSLVHMKEVRIKGVSPTAALHTKERERERAGNY